MNSSTASRVQKKWEPSLTPAFANRYNLRAFLSFHAGSAATMVPSIIRASTMTGALSLSQGTPGSPAPDVALNPAPSSTVGTCLENTHFNSALFGTYKSSSIKSKDLCRKIEREELMPLPPSKMNVSKLVCLNWHTKGQCNSNCPCLQDHVAYTPDEYALLVAWCRDHGYCTE